MYILNINRVQLLSALPKNGICIEIGVAKGAYSRAILKMAVPKKLHLIDPWEFQDDAEYKLDSHNVSNEENEIRFREVQATFDKEIKNGTVQIHRGYSYQVVSSFNDHYFDWIYVDAVHTYQGVRIDLESFYPKVKEGGFILGHDFTNRPGPLNRHFGVVKAVIDFLRYFPCDFLAVTNESHPSFLLAKKPYANCEGYIYAKKYIEENFEVLFEVGIDHLKYLKHKEFGKRTPEKCFWAVE